MLQSEYNKGMNEDEVKMIPSELQVILNDCELSDEKKDRIIKIFTELSSTKEISISKGSIPHPAILKAYSEIVIGGAERIVAMIEAQENQRLELEELEFTEGLKRMRRGQIFTLSVGLVGLALTSDFAMFGHEVLSGIIGTTTILGLVAVTLLHKRVKKSTT